MDSAVVKTTSNETRVYWDQDETKTQKGFEIKSRSKPRPRQYKASQESRPDYKYLGS